MCIRDSCSSVISRSLAMFILHRLSSSSSSRRWASARCKRSFNTRSDSSDSFRTRSICKQDAHEHCLTSQNSCSIPITTDTESAASNAESTIHRQTTLHLLLDFSWCFLWVATFDNGTGSPNIDNSEQIQAE